MNQITVNKQTSPRPAAQSLYTGYCVAMFTVLGLSVLLINLFLPSLRRRRLVAGMFSRAFLRAAGVPFSVEGLNRLPQVPCVVVANHASRSEERRVGKEC